MKVLYVFCDSTSSEGVFKKVFSKIKYLNYNNVDTLGLFFREDNTNDDFVSIPNTKFIKYHVPKIHSLYQRRYLRDLVKPKIERKIRLDAIFKRIKGEIVKHNFDLIIFRYPNASKQLLSFMKQYNGKVIFECNANELFVLEKFASNSKYKNAELAFLDEKKYGNAIMRLAKGVVSVGFEVEKYQVEKTDGKILSRTIANGLDLNKIPERTIPGVNENRINALFLTGSPRFVDGMDLILNGLAEYKGEYDLNLIIAGPVSNETMQMVKELGLEKRVEFLGLLTGEELNKVFNICHFAIGTMGLHRKGLIEHSALKVCEYIGRGIPFVLSYDDTNILGENIISKYYMKMPAGEVYLDFNNVMPWLFEILQDEDHVSKMRKFAEANIDYSIKMNEFKEFLESCYDK